MSAAEKQESEVEEAPKRGLVAWCERNGGADPEEVRKMGNYLRLDTPTLARMPIGDPSWLTKLRQQYEAARTRRDAWSARWAQQSVGPEPFRKLTGQQMHQILAEPLRVLARRWQPSLGALIIGPTGAGKSLAACFLARRTVYDRMQATNQWHYQADAPEGAQETAGGEERPFLSERYGVLWAAAPSLAMARRRHPMGKGEPRLVDRAMRCDLLVLDDIGREPVQDTVISDVLWERFEGGLVTIATCGEREEVIAARYGAALVRRIQEVEGRKGFLVDLFAAAAA